jgi:predicted permease
MAPSGLFESFMGALQASLSVLLVISYGGIAAKLKFLNKDNAKAISKVSVRMFLPALLLTKIGSQLEMGLVSRYGVILVWAIATHVVSFLLGMFGHYVLKLPSWTAIAVMFNNSTSYPLLLIEALGETGILETLIGSDEQTKDAIERAKAYFLVYATVSSCLTFAVGPRLIDTENPPELEENEQKDGDDVAGATNGTDGANDDRDVEEGATERTGLLSNGTPSPSDAFHGMKQFFASISSPGDLMGERRAYVIPKSTWVKLSTRTKWWLLFVTDFFSAPLVGAILGAIIGLTPALHKAFFADAQEGGIFSAWLTSSLKNIGNLFVPLPVVIAGVSLFLSIKDEKMDKSTLKKIPWGTWSYVLVVRFLVWPVASIGLIYLCASRTGIVGDDPMLWFTLMMMPTGPPAMKLVTLVQVSGGSEDEEHNISRLLTVSRLPSPRIALFMSLTCCSWHMCCRLCCR